MVHYNIGVNQEYVDILKDFNVKTCIFGHLHAKAEKLKYEKDEISFICTSCDLIDFIHCRSSFVFFSFILSQYWVRVNY